MSSSKQKSLKTKQLHFSPSKRRFPLWYAIVGKGSTSSFYLIKLLFWVIITAKIDFWTKIVFCVFANLGNIFGET